MLMGSINSGPIQNTTSIGSSTNPSASSNAVAGSARGGELSRVSNMEKARGVKHLLYNELMERKSRGLCFRCGEQYHPLHQCVARSLWVLILGDDEAPETMVGEEQEGATMEIEQGNENKGLQCRLIGLMGFSFEELDFC